MEVIVAETHGEQGIFESIADSIRVVFGNKCYKVKTRVTIVAKYVTVDEFGGVRVNFTCLLYHSLRVTL